MKSGPDVFADALVPGKLSFPERPVPGTSVPGTIPFPECPPSPERSDRPRIRRPALKSSPLHIDRLQASVVSLPLVAAGASSRANSASGSP